MSLKTLYLIAGPNGSGKSTLVRWLALDHQMEFLNADDIAAGIGDSGCARAGRILVKRRDQVLAEKRSFALESTIAGRSHLNTMKNARSEGYGIIMIYVFNEDVSLNLARVKHRAEAGEHSVPQDVVMSRFEKSLGNFNITAELADVWQVYYTGSSEYEPVARSMYGHVLIQDQHKYNMFKQMTR